MKTKSKAGERPPKFMGQRWGGLKWSRWVRFSEKSAFKKIPACPGLYRVRPATVNCLAYLGETGRELRSRLMTLRNELSKSKMPFNDPHTAAPKLWAWQREKKWEYECSVAKYNGVKQQRRAIECSLIWKYRSEKGISPLCNFGRTHPKYSSSGPRSSRLRGRRLPNGNIARFKRQRPLMALGAPSSSNWMGLQWIELIGGSHIPEEEGIYKIFNRGTGQLLYIGQSKNLELRILSHLRNIRRRNSVRIWTHCIGLYHTSDASARLELENDLIGAYYDQYEKSPKWQFGNKNYRSGS